MKGAFNPTEHERRILGFLDQRGATHRSTIVWELASPDSKIGRARDNGSGLGGGSSGNGEAMICAVWCRRLEAAGLVRRADDRQGFYRHHEITPVGRRMLRPLPLAGCTNDLLGAGRC